MRLQTKAVNGVFTALLSDSLSFADHLPFRKLLDDIQDTRCSQCVFNLTELTRIDSSGLGMIMLAIEEAKERGWKLTAVGASGTVLQLLQLSRLDQFLMP